jgi:hypothetical protein
MFDDGHNDVTVTEPTVESAAAAPPGRSRLAIVVLVVAGVLLVGSVVLAGLGFQARSQASDEREGAATALEHREALVAERRDVASDSAEVVRLTDDTPDKYLALSDAMDQLADAQNHFVDVVNHAAELYNQGDEAGAVAVFTTDAAQALDDLVSKQAAAVQALHDAQDAITQLQEAVR